MESVHVFKTDKKTIDTQKVTFSIWKNRANAEFVRDFTETLSKFVEEKRVFNEIEFYLPQLAHLIIHLDTDWPSQSLERLAVILSQTSIHTALQLLFMFIAAMEDYQLENADGKVNPTANLDYYLRCSRLIHNVERAVVYGSPVLSANYNMHSSRPVSVDGSKLLDASYYEKNNRADEIMQANSKAQAKPRPTSMRRPDPTVKVDATLLHGMLLYKRVLRKSSLSTKTWKSRYFKVEHRILFCYKDDESKVPLRSIVIRDFDLNIVAREKYQFQFELFSKITGVTFKLRADTEATFDFWVQGLRRESQRVPQCVSLNPHMPNGTMPHSAAGGIHSISNARPQTMTPAERKRFEYFQQQRNFIGQLTGICDRLRYLEKPERPHFLHRDLSELVIPPFCYLPLCRSVDTWRYVLRPLPLESHAFTTKARCPALMLFEVEEHTLLADGGRGGWGGGCDVATFLSMELHNYGDDKIPVATGNLNAPSSFHESKDTSHQVERQQSLFTQSQYSTSDTTRPTCWLPEGTGILRIKDSAFIAAAIPPQSSLNNPALREKQKESVPSKLPTIPEFQRLSIRQPSAASRASQRLSMRGGGNYYDLNRLASIPEAQRLSLRAGPQRSDIAENRHLPPPPPHASSLHSASDSKAVTFMTGGETMKEKTNRLRVASPYGHLPGFRVDGLIAKSNDDLRQEAFVMQLIVYFQIAFQVAKLPVWLFTYRILSTSKTTGLIQLIPDAVSIDGLKKRADYPGSLRKHFEKSYGLNADGSETPALVSAINEFVKSLAGYSIICYALAIKDRHNGNIMIDSTGRLIHIDFGFVFGLAPGKQFSMETAPWKLTEEMVEVMGGRASSYFTDYKALCKSALIEVRKHSEAVVIMMEIMTYKSSFPAFRYNPSAIKDFKKRMMMKVQDKDLSKVVSKLIDRSQYSTGTGMYDSFQTATNGIAK